VFSVDSGKLLQTLDVGDRIFTMLDYNERLYVGNYEDNLFEYKIDETSKRPLVIINTHNVSDKI